MAIKESIKPQKKHINSATLFTVMVQFHFLFIVVVAGVTTLIDGSGLQTGCPNDCSNNVMNDEFRNFILDTFNGYRSRLAKGELSSLNGTNYPSGKNINKVEWDCELEAISRETSEQCFHYYSDDYIVSSFGGASNETIHETPDRQFEIQMQIEFWHYYQLRNESSETQVYIPWSYMTDKVEKIGCYFGPRKCDDKFSYIYQTVVCALSPRMCFYDANNTLQCPNATYTVGAPCSVDSDCTNPNGFTSCDATLGLCTKTSTTSTETPVTSTTTTSAPATTTETIPVTTTTTVATTTTAPYNPCSNGWVYYAPTNKCYRYVNASTGRTQPEVEQWCVNQGKKGHLASIHDVNEDNFVKSLFPVGVYSVLIGYKEQAWTDGTPLDYTNFEATGGNNFCAAYSSPTSKWKSVDCYSTFGQFVCKRNL